MVASLLLVSDRPIELLKEKAQDRGLCSLLLLSSLLRRRPPLWFVVVLVVERGGVDGR